MYLTLYSEFTTEEKQIICDAAIRHVIELPLEYNLILCYFTFQLEFCQIGNLVQ